MVKQAKSKRRRFSGYRVLSRGLLQPGIVRSPGSWAVVVDGFRERLTALPANR